MSLKTNAFTDKLSKRRQDDSVDSAEGNDHEQQIQDGYADLSKSNSSEI